jgi:glucose/mannose transport system permease protein
MLKKLSRALPLLVVSPSLLASLIFVYGFIAMTTWLSFTRSRLLPNWELTGVQNYEALFVNDRWWVSISNLLIFGGLFIAITMFIGLLMAIFLDQKIRFEGVLRSIYLYPMALSFIVTGTSWRWILTPSESSSFTWLQDPDKAIYCVVIAGVWQSSGFAMALFLAGLRGIDGEIVKAASVDGASMPLIYRKIIIPSIRPVFFSVMLILAHIAIKSFDLIMALTGGGPGTSTDVPAIFMYQFSFNRGQLGLGAASAVMMLMTIIAVLVPMIYAETKQ